MQASLTRGAATDRRGARRAGPARQATTRVGQLSGGEQRRLDIACALLGDPDVLFLDEPSNGLDVESRRRVWDLVAAPARPGGRDPADDPLPRRGAAAGGPDRADARRRIVRSGTPADIVADLPSTISFATSSLRSAPPLPDLGHLRVVEHRGTATIETHDLQASLASLLALGRDPRRAARRAARRDRLAGAGLPGPDERHQPTTPPDHATRRPPHEHPDHDTAHDHRHDTRRPRPRPGPRPTPR